MSVVSPARAAAVANDLLDAFPTAAVSANAVRAALAVSVAGRASWWDALLVVTAAESGCTAILTEDIADGTTLHGVRLLNPFAGGELPPEVRALLTAD